LAQIIGSAMRKQVIHGLLLMSFLVIVILQLGGCLQHNQEKRIKEFTKYIPDVVKFMTDNLDLFTELNEIPIESPEDFRFSALVQREKNTSAKIYISGSIDKHGINGYSYAPLQDAEYFSDDEKELTEKVFALKLNNIQLKNFQAGYYVFMEEAFVQLFAIYLGEYEYGDADYIEEFTDGWYVIIDSWIPG
jgi:hypothetical protein